MRGEAKSHGLWGKSHGLWERTAPPGPQTPALAGDVAAEVAVVGAGFTGLSAALHLAERGVDVVVLEAAEVGYGASGRNVGLVNAGMWVMPDALEAALGPVHGPRLLALLGDGPAAVFDLVARHGIPCEAEPVGTLHCAVGQSGLAEIEARAAQWSRLGAPVELLDATATAARTGTQAFAGALLDRRAGTIQPLAYVRGLARAAIAAGARVHGDSPVVATQRAGDAWRLVTARGSVRAARVIAATDAYTGAVWPELRREQVALPYFNLATAPLSSNLRRSILPERQGAWDTRSVLSHFRLDAQGRLIVGSVGALRGTGTAVHRAWARRMVRRLFPQLGEAPFEAEWYGRIGMTADHLPRFHRLAEGVVSVSGYNGRGIAPGTVFGRELARLLTGEIDEAGMALPLTAPRRAPARLAREAFIEAGAQVAHLPPR